MNINDEVRNKHITVFCERKIENLKPWPISKLKPEKKTNFNSITEIQYLKLQITKQ